MRSGLAARVGALWARHRTPESRLSRRITIAATLVFLLLVCRWRPWDLFDRGGFSTDFYDAQAHAFWRLRLDVPAAAAGQEGFLIDGKTYLYYGPLLAIARMPFALFGSWADGRLSRLSLVFAFFIVCTLAFHVARGVNRLIGSPATATPRRYAILVVAVACSPALSLAGWNSVYDETELWAFAFFLATVVALLRLWEAPTRRSWMAAAGAAICTVLTRTNVGFGALTALALVGVLLWRRDRRAGGSAIAAAIGGVLLSMAINFAKFATLLDLPADRQVLTLRSPARAAWFAGNDGSFFSIRVLPTTVVQYLRPDAIRVERLVPFGRFGPLATEYGSYPLETNSPSSSLTASATLLFVLALLGTWVIVRRRSWPLMAVMAGALIAAVPTFLIGFIANRYLTDMLPALVVPAAAALATVSLPAGAAARWARGLLALLVLWGSWINISLATWTQNLQEPGFTEMRYRLDGLVFGGAPPSVIDLVRGVPAPRDGVVAIDDDCAGLYIAQQRAWVALELADGRRRLHGIADPAGGTVLISTLEGELRIVFAQRIAFAQWSATATYSPSGGDPAIGEAVAIGDATVTIEITSDPVTGGFTVEVEGRPALFAFAAPDLTTATVSDNFRVESRANGDTPVCDYLQSRRGRGSSLGARGSA